MGAKKEKELTMDLDASHYFNNQSVREALHLQNFTGPWHQCIVNDTAANG